MSERVIYQDSSSRLSIEEDKDGVTVQYKIFPLKGYGNNYGYDIEVYDNKVTIYEFHDGWNGTGSKELVRIEDAEFAKSMLERLKSIKNPEELEKVIELAKKREEEIGKKIDELITKVIDELEELELDERVKKLLESPDAKEQIKDLLYEYLTDP